MDNHLPSTTQAKTINKARAWIGLALSTLSVVLIVFAVAPARRVLTMLETPGQGFLVSSAGEDDPSLAGSDGVVILPANYLLLLDVPALLKNSNVDVFRLRVEQGNSLVGTSPLAGWQTSVEASLQLPGLDVHPAGSIFQRLGPDHPADFHWRVTGAGNTRVAGTLWMYVHFTPPDGGQTAQILLLARSLTVDTRSFLGLPAVALCSLGALGLLAGCALGMPAVLQHIRQT